MIVTDTGWRKNIDLVVKICLHLGSIKLLTKVLGGDCSRGGGSAHIIDRIFRKLYLSIGRFFQIDIWVKVRIFLSFFVSGWQQGRSSGEQAGPAGHSKRKSFRVECNKFLYFCKIPSAVSLANSFNSVLTSFFCAGALCRDLCKDQRECRQGLLRSDERNQVCGSVAAMLFIII